MWKEFQHRYSQIWIALEAGEDMADPLRHHELVAKMEKYKMGYVIDAIIALRRLLTRRGQQCSPALQSHVI